MRLLVSVSNASEAAAALTGGADIIDAKDPLKGALGAVSLESLRAICATVNGGGADRPVTAALGDHGDEHEIERAALAYVTAGAGLVKIGCPGIDIAFRVHAVLSAAVHAIRNTHGGVVAVAYLDRA